jgi:hypothetical protein
MSAEVTAAGPQREDREPEAVRAEAEKSSAENSEATSVESDATSGESAEQKPGLLSLDDLFDGAQGSSCSIDGICD